MQLFVSIVPSEVVMSALVANSCFGNMAVITSELMITCFALQAVQWAVSHHQHIYTINNTKR